MYCTITLNCQMSPHHIVQVCFSVHICIINADNNAGELCALNAKVAKTRAGALQRQDEDWLYSGCWSNWALADWLCRAIRKHVSKTALQIILKAKIQSNSDSRLPFCLRQQHSQSLVLLYDCFRWMLKVWEPGWILLKWKPYYILTAAMQP